MAITARGYQWARKRAHVIAASRTEREAIRYLSWLSRKSEKGCSAQESQALLKLTVSSPWAALKCEQIVVPVAVGVSLEVWDLAGLAANIHIGTFTADEGIEDIAGVD